MKKMEKIISIVFLISSISFGQTIMDLKARQDSLEGMKEYYNQV